MKKIVDSIVSYKENSLLADYDEKGLDKIVKLLEDIEPKRVLIDADLSGEEKLSLIHGFYDWYYDTDQDLRTFAKEFYIVVQDIFNGYVPVKLEFLDDYTDLLINLIPRLENKIKQKLGDCKC